MLNYSLDQHSSPLESRLTPHYLHQGDRVWIEAAIDIYMQFVGRTASEVRRALAQADFFVRDVQKFRFVDFILQDIFIKQDPGVKKLAQLIRAELFLIGAKPIDLRGFYIETVSKKLGLSIASIEQLMFADIKAARPLRQPLNPLDPEEIRLKANLRLVQALLLNSDKIVISMRGMCRPLIQSAKWLGLIASISRNPSEESFKMEMSGPLSILTSTKIYGHALGRLVPFLVLAEQFTFEAAVRQNHAKKTLVIRQGDPIFPKEGLKKFDSQLERKFYDAFLKATDDWNLTREPEPLVSGQGLVFPDFSIWHKVRPDIKYYLEIVGFWTKEYLSEKMSKYALVSDAKLILCVNEKFAVDINELPSFANIVWFKRSIKPSAVLEVLASDG